MPDAGTTLDLTMAGTITRRSSATAAKHAEVVLEKLRPVLTGAVIVSMVMASLATPAFALGGCGPNRHRGAFGLCVFGGQNQGSCLRRTGHVATRMPNGTLRCL